MGNKQELMLGWVPACHSNAGMIPINLLSADQSIAALRNDMIHGSKGYKLLPLVQASGASSSQNVIPVRGRVCLHDEAFDLQTFRANSDWQQHSCPICHQPLDELLVDELALRLQRATPHTRSKSVKLTIRGGHLHAELPATHSHDPTHNATAGLVDSGEPVRFLKLKSLPFVDVARSIGFRTRGDSSQVRSPKPPLENLFSAPVPDHLLQFSSHSHRMQMRDAPEIGHPGNPISGVQSK
jgi:hypothetical protein